jgi:hypothetical protein
MATVERRPRPCLQIPSSVITFRCDLLVAAFAAPQTSHHPARRSCQPSGLQARMVVIDRQSRHRRRPAFRRLDHVGRVGVNPVRRTDRSGPCATSSSAISRSQTLTGCRYLSTERLNCISAGSAGAAPDRLHIWNEDREFTRDKVHVPRAIATSTDGLPSGLDRRLEEDRSPVLLRRPRLQPQGLRSEATLAARRCASPSGTIQSKHSALTDKTKPIGRVQILDSVLAGAMASHHGLAGGRKGGRVERISIQDDVLNLAAKASPASIRFRARGIIQTPSGREVGRAISTARVSRVMTKKMT